MATLAEQARALFPYMPAELLNLYATAWAETGSSALALQTIRQNRDVYDRYFPGNLRADGTVRLDEMSYLSTVEGYRRRLSDLGVPPDTVLGPERLRALIEGDKSPSEFGDQISTLWAQVMSQSDQIRQAYGDYYGSAGFSDAAIFGAAIDGTGDPLSFEHRIRSAQVGGQAATYGFDLARSEAERLASFGLDSQAANKVFAAASTELPNLNDLVARFNDPNDPLTIEDYADAVVVGRPEQLNVVQRLLGRQAAQFSATSSTYAADNQGRLVGLRQT